MAGTLPSLPPGSEEAVTNSHMEADAAEISLNPGISRRKGDVSMRRLRSRTGWRSSIQLQGGRWIQDAAYAIVESMNTWLTPAQHLVVWSSA